MEACFLNIKLEDVKFDNDMTDLGFNSILHSLESQVEGYLSQARKRGAFLGAYRGGSQGAYGQEKEQEKEQEQVQEEVQEEVQEKEKYSYSFSLKKKMSYDNLTEEYQNKLFAACMLIDGKLSRYEDFIVSLRSNGYQYKNFAMTYQSWDKDKDYKNYTPTPYPSKGKDWTITRVGNGRVIFVNKKTYEVKEGRET